MNICNQLLAGVAALHAGGIIHRDLKPNNVMLETGSSGPHVSIMDFGLARPQDSENTLFGSGVIAGTPGYMAPEMLRGERPTKATDLFALGIVLHQVLTGERPVVVGRTGGCSIACVAFCTRSRGTDSGRGELPLVRPRQQNSCFPARRRDNAGAGVLSTCRCIRRECLGTSRPQSWR